ncbi:unnamed protein product [Closterium sp. NIES-53]
MASGTPSSENISLSAEQEKGARERPHQRTEGLCVRAEGLVRKGNLSKAVSVLQTTPLAKVTPETIAALRAKHPEAIIPPPHWVTDPHTSTQGCKSPAWRVSLSVGERDTITILFNRTDWNFFLPVQFGLAVQGGAECIIHSVRALLQEDKSQVALQFDVENAFNNVETATFLDVIQWSDLNPLLPLVRNLYDGPSVLLLNVAFSEDKINSTMGVHQGDPLGLLLFAAAIQPALLHVAMAFTEVTIVAYADDITLVGPQK